LVKEGTLLGFWKKSVLFTTGGSSYVALELLWRGRSHSTMFLAGGACFLLLGGLNHAKPRLPMPLRGIAGAGVVTMVELLTGLLANRDYRIWDYRDLPCHFHGQICLPFTLLWVPVSMGAMGLYQLLDRLMQRECSGCNHRRCTRRSRS